MNLIWKVRAFSQFDARTFHDLIQLRLAVFVVEQDCPYQDLDGLDLQGWHLTGESESGQILVCARILPKGTTYKEYPSIGRVVVHDIIRGKGIGHEVVKRSIEVAKDKFGQVDLKISAQKHLEKLYSIHGFEQSGEGYLEDGIPHIPMIRKAT